MFFHPNHLSRLSTFTAVGLFIAITAAFARDNSDILRRYQPPPNSRYDIARANRVTHRNNVWMNVTNWGFFGNLHPDDPFNMQDPEYPGTWASQCEFPGGSEIQYIFCAGLWIGALVQEGSFEYARVSVGLEGWTGPANNNYELEPGEVGGLPVEDHGVLERSCIPGAVNYLGQAIYSSEAIAPQEFIAIYCDTLVDSAWTGFDIIDGPHYPLGLKVTQKAMAWDAVNFNDFIIFDYTIKNIGSNFLKNLYLGFYVDGDIGHESEVGRWTDDVTGFLAEYQGQPLNVPYSADNDGRPVGYNSGNDFSCPGVSGAYFLLSPQDTVYRSFNYWISNGNSDLDFGPSWMDDGSQGNWTATYGTPDGDSRKYFIMSNKEIDYDQWRVADHPYILSHPQVFTNPFTGQTTTHDWKLENLTNALDIANGYDTRYLISWGPLGIFDHWDPSGEPIYRLHPGDSLRLTFAYVGGEGFHDPNNPQNDCSGNNPIDPSRYVYTDLVYNCLRAQELYDLNFTHPLPYSPQNFHISATPGDTNITLIWDSYPTLPLVRVNVYRHTLGQPYGVTPLNPLPLYDSTWTDYDVSPGLAYFYRAQAKLDTNLSQYSQEDSVILGAPLQPTGLAVDSSGNGWVSLSWDVNTEPDLDHYTIYRHDTSSAFLPVADIPAGAQIFRDQGLTNGLEYTYRITALDHNGYESWPSNTVSEIPMGFYQDLLVIREIKTSGVFEWPDSVLSVYYQQLFSEIGENPDTMSLSYWNGNVTFASLPQLSPYKIVWLMHDAHAQTYYNYNTARNSILSQYIENGGKVIISGRNIFCGGFRYAPYWAWQSITSTHILQEHFKLDSIWVTRYIDPMNHYPEFTSAVPALPEYPELDVDTAKVRQAGCTFYNPDLWLPEVDAMIPEPEAQTFYTFQSATPDSSPLQGQAVGVYYLTPYFANVILTFPLYAMQPYDSVKALAEKLLGDIRLGVTEPQKSTLSLPTAFALKSVYPNPFNATAAIRYELPTASFVSLRIYDLAGRVIAMVVDGWRSAGTHEVTFDGKELASGMYFVKMQAGEYVGVRKMVLLK